MRRAILAALLLSIAAENSAARQRAMIYGHGLQSCGKWNEGKDQDARGDKLARIVLTAWMTGYVTGVAEGLRPQVQLRETDVAGMLSWIDKYCTEKPLDSIHKATYELVLELGQK